jgi:NAD-dependent deacetylase
MKNLKILKTDKVVILTGSGISKASGISTFRDKGGVWDRYDVDKVCCLSGIKDNKEDAWNFFRETYNDLNGKLPNSAHYSLVELEDYLNDGNCTIITQNIDGLHQLAGSKNVLEMHGNYKYMMCSGYYCKTKYPIEDFIFNENYQNCPKCGKILRPSVVMFEEPVYHLKKANELISKCNYFFSIGTSGLVIPAASYPMKAWKYGANVFTINLDGYNREEERFYIFNEKAEEFLPKFINQLIKE